MARKKCWQHGGVSRMSSITLKSGECREYDKVTVEEGFAIGATRKQIYKRDDCDEGLLGTICYNVDVLALGAMRGNYYYETEAFPVTRVEELDGVT